MGNPIAACEKLSVGYGGVPVLQNVSFTLVEGESMLLIGHNGAGKSTLLKTLFGLLPPVGGRGELLGLDSAKGSPKEFLRSGARYFGQGARAFRSLSVEEDRRVLSNLYGFEPRESPFPAGKRIGRLSVGQRRLEALRLLSAGRPRLYLLDEPSAGIEPRNLAIMTEWIEEQQADGISFIVVEHAFRRFLRLCENTLVLRSGNVTYWGY